MAPQTVDYLHDYGTLKQIERQAIMDWLEALDWNHAKTAASLEISVRTLSTRLAEWQKEPKAEAMN